MAVNYALAYLDALDAIYKKNSVTSILDATPDMYKLDENSAKTVYTRRVSFDEGLATYSRANGYDDTLANVDWESHTFSMDRGKMFDFDAMDKIEAKTTALELAAEYYRTNCVPEIDAYRFYKIYAIKTAADANADLTVDTAIQAIDTAGEVLDDLEVPEEGRYLFVSPTMYNLMKNNGDLFNTRVVTNNNGIVNRNITTFDNMPMLKIPKSRFSTTPTFSATNGYAVGGYYLNFAIIHLSSIISLIKHNKPKLITPESHQTKDAYRSAVRVYHDLFIPTNKKNGIYLHRKSTGI